MKNSFAENPSLTAPPNSTAASVLPNIAPAFTRYPRPGFRDPYSGLCRSQLFAAVKSGKVKSFSIKTPGATRGVRCIDCASLRAYIESFGYDQPDARELQGYQRPDD